VIVHHVEMHEFCLWCDFKSLKKNICKKMVCEKPFKTVEKFVLKFQFEKNEKDLNLKDLN
jgi:hypothetical protein